MLSHDELHRWTLRADSRSICSHGGSTPESSVVGGHAGSAVPPSIFGSQAWEVLPERPANSSLGGRYPEAAPSQAPSPATVRLNEEASRLMPSLVDERRPAACSAGSMHAMEDATEAAELPLKPEPQDAVSIETAVEALSLVRRYFSGKMVCPAFCLSAWLVFFGSILAVGMHLAMPTWKAELHGLGAELSTDDEFSLTWAAFEAATDLRNSARGGGDTLCRPFDISIGYFLDGAPLASASSVAALDDVHLRQIAQFERDLLSASRTLELCDQAQEGHREFCSRGLSFAHLALPTLNVMGNEVVPTSLTLDGGATTQLPFDAVLEVIRKQRLENVLFEKAHVNTETPKALRSVFRFSFPCLTEEATVEERAAHRKGLEATWEEYIRGTFLPLFANTFPGATGQGGMRVYFEGTNFESLEVADALEKEAPTFIGVLVFLVVVLAMHTKRFLLTVGGAAMALLPLLLATVTFSGMTGSSALSFPNHIAGFLVPGICADFLMLFTDAWRDSAQRHPGDIERIIWTYVQAGKPTLASAALTVVTGLATLASTSRHMRAVGVLLSLGSLFAWVVVSAMCVPLCMVDEKYCGACYSFGRCRRPSDPTSKARRTGRVCGRLPLKAHRYRTLLFTLPALMGVGFLFSACWRWKESGQASNIFPKEHNLNDGRVALRRFLDVPLVLLADTKVPPLQVRVCKTGDVSNAGEDGCILSWCDAPQNQVAGASDTCRCFRRRRESCDASSPSAVAVERFIGFEALSRSQVVEMIDGDLVGNATARQAMGLFIDLENASLAQMRLPPQLLQVWETSRKEVEPALRVDVRFARKSANASCGWEDLCFCGSYECKLPPQWARLRAIRAPRPSGDIGRALEAVTTRVPASRRVTIDVVLGIDFQHAVPIAGPFDIMSAWSFRNSFGVADPAAQRELYALCTQLPASLRVVSRTCWIEDFRAYLLASNRRFPLPAVKFADALVEFISTPGGVGESLLDHLWFSDGMLKACSFSFVVDVDDRAGKESAFAYMRLWQEHTRSFSAVAEHATGAVPTSPFFVRAARLDSFAKGSAVTFQVVAICSFVILVASLRSWLLPLYGCISAFLVVATSTFLLLVVNGEVSQLELFAVTLSCIGAVDYAVHVLHAYGSDQALLEPVPLKKQDASLQVRIGRVAFAHKSVSRAVLTSAMLRMVLAVLLGLSNVVLFRRIGFAVAVALPVSAFAALVPLCGALLMTGPLQPRTGLHLVCKALRAAWRTCSARLAALRGD
mmetsp:Transcript_39513/g.113683  ORF Transcript_39513/g.113683 Transcript_39513/m.113683 type:complete len:1250 (+) Transcript_39513:146-3895(+)